MGVEVAVCVDGLRSSVQHRMCSAVEVCRQGRLPSSGGEGERAGGWERRHRGGRSRRGLSGCDGHHEGL